MADQDAPLDLTIKKPLAVPSEQGSVTLNICNKAAYSGRNLYTGDRPVFKLTLNLIFFFFFLHIIFS